MEKTRTKETLELLFISILGLVATIGATVRYSEVSYTSIPFFEKYFYVTLLVATATSLILAVKKWRWEREIALFFLLWVFMVIFQAKDIRAVSIWLDEDFQISTSILLLPVEAGWNQHQPPIHFAILGGWLSLLGATEFTTRIFTLLFSATGAAFVAYYIRSWLSSWWPVLGIMPLFLYQPYIIRYSYEVRPVGIGLFCMIVWFGAIYRQLRQEDVSIFSSLPIAIFTYFSLMSVGFQPPLLGLAIAIAVCLSSSRPKNKIFTIGAMFLGFLVFLPLQIHILQEAPPRFSRIGNFSILDLLNSLSVKNLAPFVNSFLLPTIPFAVVILLFGILLHKEWGWLKRILAKTRFFAITLGIIFLVAVPFFSAYLDWPLNPYYFLGAWPLVIFWLAHLVQQSMPHKLFVMPSVIFCFLYIVLQYLPNPFFRVYGTPLPPRADMRGAIQRALEIAGDGKRTILFPVCGGNSNDWCPNWIVGRDVYLNKSAISGLNLNFSKYEDQKFFLDYALHPQTDERIIWLFQPEWSKFPFPGEQIVRTPEFDVYSFLNVVLLVQDEISGDSRLAFYQGLKKFEKISRESGRDGFWLRIQLAMLAKTLGQEADYSFWRSKLPTSGADVDARVWLEYLKKIEDTLSSKKR